MVTSSSSRDYYAVLQVHPGADREVIEAAYRQLMKKYHPDMAGGDPSRSAAYHQRAKTINEAYSVLRDPALRQRYDNGRGVVAPPRPQPPGAGADYRPQPEAANQHATPSPPADQVAWEETSEEPESLFSSTLYAPFRALAAAYYLLPGPYEWESGNRLELLTACLLPVLGVGAFLLATGRLAPWVGRSLNATLLAWAILVLVSVPAWRALPRLLMAALPSVLLVTGLMDPLLRQASVPAWLAWALLAILSLILSARLYIFGVLPTIGVCWLLTLF